MHDINETPPAGWVTPKPEISIQNIEPEVLAEAHGYVRNCLNNIAEWPKDKWFSLGLYWDLNIWVDGDSLCATMHPVVDGSTETDRWYTLLRYPIIAR